MEGDLAERRWAAGWAAVAAAFLVAFATLADSDSAVGADVDCSDFGSQAEAQNYFDSHGPGDPAGLDGDGDGEACESNPCPCASPDGGGGGGGGSGGGGGGSSPGPGGGSHTATVVSVTDGDTIKVQRRGRERDVRIIGIDTPEVFFGEECGGAQASASMKKLLDPGDRVKLIRDPSQDGRDAFDRLLRYVEIGGRDVGRKQIRRGWAQVYVFETPFERVRSYRRQRDGARQHDRGAWRRCDGDFHQPL